MTRGVFLASATVLAGCARGEPGPGAAPPAEPAAAPRVSDSLILTAPGGVTVWLSEGRRATDSASGAECLERTLEIRRDTTRIKVPLLYTVSTPVLLDDTTLKAELAHNCRQAEPYRVNLLTGRPTPLRP